MKLKVNGIEVSLTIDPETPLLWALRDEMGLKGARFGCGMAQCGACTVHADGIAIRSCVIPVGQLQDKAITTVEGLGADHPVIKAWLKHKVAQCGYCQPGQIMTACALLKAKADASPEDWDVAMGGHLCRCGTYPRIKKALAELTGREQSHSNLQENIDQEGVTHGGSYE